MGNWVGNLFRCADGRSAILPLADAERYLAALLRHGASGVEG